MRPVSTSGFLPSLLFQISADFFIAVTFYMHIFQRLDSNLCLALWIASCQNAPSILKLLHSAMFTYSHLCYDHIKYFTSTYFKIKIFIGLSYVRMTHFDPHSVFSSTELCQAVSWHITRSNMNQSVYLFAVYLAMVSVTQTMQHRVAAWSVGNEMDRMWKKVGMPQFELLSQYMYL